MIKQYARVYVLCVMTILAVPACSVFQKQKIDIFVFEEELKSAAPLLLRVQEPTILYANFQPQGQYPYTEIIRTLGKKYGLPITFKTGEYEEVLIKGDTTGVINTWIKEEKFLHFVETKYSVTGIISVHLPGKKGPIVSLLYTEESTTPLTNFYHLYSILEIMIQGIADVLLFPAN